MAHAAEESQVVIQVPDRSLAVTMNIGPVVLTNTSLSPRCLIC